MIDIPKSLVKAIQNGQASLDDLINHLSNYPINEVLRAFAELIMLSEEYINKPQITVTQAEFEAIKGLFKIKGQKILEDGTIVEETRGRKRVTK
jgi:hypothetical protein